MSFWNSPDGNAPRFTQLRECVDCSAKVTCHDEREEFDYEYICDLCYERRKEDLKLEDETENPLFV